MSNTGRRFDLIKLVLFLRGQKIMAKSLTRNKILNNVSYM